MTGVELVQDVHAEIGEGPIWDDRTGWLHWVDIPAGLVHRYSPDDGSDRPIAVGQPVGSLALGEKGGLALALRSGFALMPAVAVVHKTGDMLPGAGFFNLARSLHRLRGQSPKMEETFWIAEFKRICEEASSERSAHRKGQPPQKVDPVGPPSPRGNRSKPQFHVVRVLGK